MKPELEAFVIVTCAHHAVTALMVLAAGMLDSEGFLIVALLYAFFGAYSYETPKPTECPHCGHAIKVQKDEED
ncbi:MAG: hypothetical protein HDR50_04840 [Desulfovibrio sp.]|uniref:hypothetical protein n=1 Tax=Desulfovibrio sp. TaxID=885 RepID=UPI001A698D23|nr:hypothetical protein [Desulfovibrio sp.]MBD5416982.1 hypothetical protein [Desulfovibrio sp.]